MAIAKTLMEENVPKREYWSWTYSGVSSILINITYTGDLILQKTYREDFRTKKTVINRGERDMYYAEGAHEAIIDKATFEAVQEEMKRRRTCSDNCTTRHQFSGLLKCGICGSPYHHKVRKTCNTWMCYTYDRKGKKCCPSKQVPEEALIKATEEVIGSLDNLEVVDSILVNPGNELVFRLKNGTEEIKVWEDRSRRESWTP